MGIFQGTDIPSPEGWSKAPHATGHIYKHQTIAFSLIPSGILPLVFHPTLLVTANIYRALRKRCLSPDKHGKRTKSVLDKHTARGTVHSHSTQLDFTSQPCLSSGANQHGIARDTLLRQRSAWGLVKNPILNKGVAHQAVIPPKMINIPRLDKAKSRGIPPGSKHCFGNKGSRCSLKAPGCALSSVTRQSWRWRRRRAGKDSAKHPNTEGTQEKHPTKPPLPPFCLCSWDLPALVTLRLNGRMLLSLSFPGESRFYSPPREEEPGAGCFTHWHLQRFGDRTFLEPCQ